jgi:signal transduction histidine kinase
MSSQELASIEESVNTMADRLVQDRRLLAENVQSLELSNRELVEARDQVLRSARLASVGALAAGIAHEVGNPLGAILGYIDVARARGEKAGEDTVLLEALRSEAGRIDRIVRSLLDYSRPPPAHSGPVDPRAVLRRVRDLLEAQGKLGDVTVEWDLGGQEALWVDTDAHRLEQVMVNLLLNASDAVDEESDGRIRVSLAREPVRAPGEPARRESDPPDVSYAHRRRTAQPGALSGRDDLVVIRVRDNGPGISTEDLGSLFDPFFTTKEPGEGSGLGLFVCARLVEGMGGDIEAANVPKGGAEFTVRLPAARDPGEEEGP